MQEENNNFAANTAAEEVTDIHNLTFEGDTLYQEPASSGAEDPYDFDDEYRGNAEEGSYDPQDFNADTVDFANMADLVLNSVMGNGMQEVEINGQLKSIKDLTEEEQAEVVAGSFQDVIDHYENQIRELQEQGPGAGNETEAQVLNFLRNGGTLEQLASQVIESSPVHILSSMSNEELMRNQIREDYPEYTDEEIESEVEDLRNMGKLDRQAKVLRSRLESQLAEGGASYLEAQRPAQAGFSEEEYDHRINNAVNYLGNINDFNGVPVNDEVKDYLLDYAFALNEETGTTRMEDMSRDPQAALELAFWKTYGPSLLEQARQAEAEAYKRGRAEVLRGYPGEPIIKQQSTHATPTQIDFDKMNQVYQIGT